MKSLVSSDSALLSCLKKTKMTSKMLVYYSSILGVYTDNPKFMTIPIEDNMCNRSYSVFETTKIYNNTVFNLEDHVSRLFDGIDRIDLIPQLKQSEVTEIVNSVAQHSIDKQPDQDIEIRFFYSAGPGDFTLKVDKNAGAFYCVSFLADSAKYPESGVNEFTCSLAELESNLSKAKTTNYLTNCIIKKKSLDKGGYQGIKLDSDNLMIEGTSASIGFIDKSDCLVIPPFDKSIKSTTAVKLMELAEQSETKISGIRREFFSISELDQVKEAFFLGGDRVIPILSIDSKQISFIPGEFTVQFQKLLALSRLNKY